jgi:hypothetical protein
MTNQNPNGGTNDDHHPAGDEQERDLSDEDRQASLAGVGIPHEQPPPADHVRAVAHAILLIFGLSMAMILLLTAAVAFWRESALKDVIGFFGTVVATMGTLLGGVVAFYFARR